MEIGRWLEHGDTLELDLAGVGHITNRSHESRQAPPWTPTQKEQR